MNLLEITFRRNENPVLKAGFEGGKNNDECGFTHGTQEIEELRSPHTPGLLSRAEKGPPD